MQSSTVDTEAYFFFVLQWSEVGGVTAECNDSKSASGGAANSCLFNHQVTLLHQWPDSRMAGRTPVPVCFLANAAKTF